MRTDLWGSLEGILLVCFLLSKFEHRSLLVEAFSCGRGSFRKRSSCVRGYFFIRIKEDAFSKISGYVWTGPKCVVYLIKILKGICYTMLNLGEYLFHFCIWGSFMGCIKTGAYFELGHTQRKSYFC